MMDSASRFFWTDGSRQDSGRTEASVAWYNPWWKMWKTFLFTNKEVFDAELYAIREALRVALWERQTKYVASRQ